MSVGHCFSPSGNMEPVESKLTTPEKIPSKSKTY